MIKWPQHNTLIEVQSFMGLARYYQRFIQKFSKIVIPLKNRTWKTVKFEWPERCEKIFQELKKLLTTAPVLTLLDGTCNFLVYSDASLQGWDVY